MPKLSLEIAQRREVRWRILRILDAGRPLGVVETLLLSVLQDQDLPVTAHELRRELVYLEDHNLVRIPARDVESWVPCLTSHGIDVVEYETDSPPGVARPRRWS